MVYRLKVGLSLFSLACCVSPQLLAADGRWFADQGDGTYRNPVLIGDYSDPDVIRVGDDFYLTASSFTDVPGLPILHSRDLVNWTIIGHALAKIPPDAHFAVPRRGGGVWAPAIRHRNGRFMIYYPDPDGGIYVVSAVDPRGPWTSPVQVDATPGVIDPAPFWDDDGKGWLAYAYAKSRSGRANIIALKRLNKEGNSTEGAELVIIDGDKQPPVMTSLGARPWQTTEGPKLYKRDGYYYVFVPSGSVKGGWQGVFRSRSITGPYEGRNVMDQGRTEANGPHQGAWVATSQEEDWFLHFQDRDSYGRVVHLQPMRWVNGWPVIGETSENASRGQPVFRHQKPKVAAQPIAAPVSDDDFADRISLAWQFGSNPSADWMSVESGWLRLKSVTGSQDLYENGAILSQKLPATSFTATTLMRPEFKREGERAGISVHGTNFAWIGVEQGKAGLQLVQVTKDKSIPGSPISEYAGPKLLTDKVWLRMQVKPTTVEVPPPDFSPYWPSMLRETHMHVVFSYSLDGIMFTPLGLPFQSRPGRWVGAQIGLFAQAAFAKPAGVATTVGYADFDWFKITP